MRIAKVVKSNSHVDYVGRVLDRLDAAEAPGPEHYRFGQFVTIPAGDSEMVGLIYNSQLLNPEYGQLGPRLSSSPEMKAVFSPDIINEQGILIGVVLVGWSEADARSRQGVPRSVIPVNSEILTMDDPDVKAFHTTDDERLALHYYAQVITHTRQFAADLLLAVLDQLERLCGDRSGAEIALLRRTLNWQQVFQGRTL